MQRKKPLSIVMNHNLVFIKSCAAAVWGALSSVIVPAIPYTAVCTLMVLADVVTARRLARRLSRLFPDERGRLKFSSGRFGRMLLTLGRVYVLLLLAAAVERVIVPDLPLTRAVAAMVCFWQAVSMLENEASACGSPWARVMRRWLIDKTERHLGIPLDELRNPSGDAKK